jgi:hypothetical protein
VEPGKRSLVKVDLRAQTRISSAWPELDRSLYFAFVRDLRHALAATHQLFLAESAIEAEGPTAALAALSERMANQFRLTEPKKYVAENARSAVETLFRRLVITGREATSRRPRYMTRGELRSEISEVLALWLAARTEASKPALLPNAEIEGDLTTHQVDLVAFSDDERPQMLFFATPLAGQQAPLIRDAIPTMVTDLRRRLPKAEYFAVLGESPEEQASGGPEHVARAILGRVEGLTILDLAELRNQFGAPELKPRQPVG